MFFSQNTFFYFFIGGRKILNIVFYTEFYNLLTEIAFGLKSKEETYKKKINGDTNLSEQYIKDKYLIHSINKLYGFAMKYNIKDSKNRLLTPKDETDAIVNFFSRPIYEWFNGWENELFDSLKPFFEMEPLISIKSGNKYICNEDSCFELAQQCTTYDQNAEQKNLFNLLRTFDQDPYVFCRKYIIVHPLIDSMEVREFKLNLIKLGINEKKVDKFIDLAYESIPEDALYKCSNCGWTVSINIENELQCIDRRCRHNTDNFRNCTSLGDVRNMKRLKPGVMRYMSIPGKLDIFIENYCFKNNIECELWPHKDVYDVRISLKEDMVIAIDTKDYRNAFVLSNKILEDDNLFSINDWNLAFIVVPDEMLQDKADYCQVVNNALSRKSKNISCIILSDLISMIREQQANECKQIEIKT